MPNASSGRPRLRIAVIVTAASIVAALVVSASDRSPAEASYQPNLIVVMFDDLGYADLGSYGSQFIQTPHLDALAAEGMRFTQYYVAAPLCSPTRTSILTGHYPARYGNRKVFCSQKGIPGHVELLPAVLRGEGYSTGHVGKWHVGMKSEFAPITRGFDVDIRIRSRLSPVISPYFDPTITIGDSEVVEHPGEHLTAVLTDYAIDFVTANQDSPFFLNLWYKAPHSPLDPPADWAALYPATDEGRFAALVSHADEQVGRLLAALDELGLRDDTLILVTSDNGGPSATHDHGPAAGPSNGPFSGGKLDVLEGGIRVPMLARWPGVVPSGALDESVLMSFDILPTFAEIAGADVTGLALAGESFLDVLDGSGPKPRPQTLFWESKLRPEPPGATANTFAVRRDEWKLLVDRDGTYLFDLAGDPAESTDVAADHPALVADLLAAHRAWRLGEGLIPHAVEASYGDVTVTGTDWTFNGGVLGLERNMLYGIDASDFSFSATVNPLSVGQVQHIARLASTWRLLILPSGRLGLEIGSNAGPPLRFASSAVLQPGQPTDVAFTLFSWKANEATVRLYVNGELQAERAVVDRRPQNQARILFGNNAERTEPFLGELGNLKLFSLSLTAGELAEVES